MRLAIIIWLETSSRYKICKITYKIGTGSDGNLMPLSVTDSIHLSCDILKYNSSASDKLFKWVHFSSQSLKFLQFLMCWVTKFEWIFYQKNWSLCSQKVTFSSLGVRKCHYSCWTAITSLNKSRTEEVSVIGMKNVYSYNELIWCRGKYTWYAITCA